MHYEDTCLESWALTSNVTQNFSISPDEMRGIILK